MIWAVMIGSTLAWATFDVVRKRLVERIPVGALAFWISVAQLPGYLVWAFFGRSFAVGSGYFVPGLLSMGLNLLANVLFLESVRRGPISVAIPVLSFTPVFVALSSIPLLDEHLSALQWLGVCIVSLGSLFLTREPNQSLRPDLLLLTFVRAPGVLPMMGVAVLWSLSPVLDKIALRHATVGVHGLLIALSGALGMAIYLLGRGQAKTLVLPKGSPRLVALGGLANVAALGLQLVSISAVMVSLFEAFKRALGVLLALAIGALFFREHISLARLGAAGSMAVGVLLVLGGG